MNKSAAENELAEILNYIKNNTTNQVTDNNDSLLDIQKQSDEAQIFCENTDASVNEKSIEETAQEIEHTEIIENNASVEEQNAVLDEQSKQSVPNDKISIQYYEDQIRHYKKKATKLENYLNNNIAGTINKKDRKIQQLQNELNNRDKTICDLRKLLDENKEYEKLRNELIQKDNKIKSLQDQLKLKDNKIIDLKEAKKQANYDFNMRLSNLSDESDKIRRELEIYKTDTFLQVIRTGENIVKGFTEPVKNKVVDLFSNVRR